MTEARWLRCTKPLEMIRSLKGRASDRKLRLWACACWMGRASRLANGTEEDCAAAAAYADGLAPRLHQPTIVNAPDAFYAAEATAQALSRRSDGMPRTRQLCLLRDIFGNPYRPITADESWRTGTVIALAHGAYSNREFGVLPFLADALEEAGCTDLEILTHCRQPGLHAQGCWVLDILLGKI